MGLKHAILSLILLQVLTIERVNPGFLEVKH